MVTYQRQDIAIVEFNKLIQSIQIKNRKQIKIHDTITIALSSETLIKNPLKDFVQLVNSRFNIDQTLKFEIYKKEKKGRQQLNNIRQLKQMHQENLRRRAKIRDKYIQYFEPKYLSSYSKTISKLKMNAEMVFFFSKIAMKQQLQFYKENQFIKQVESKTQQDQVDRQRQEKKDRQTNKNLSQASLAQYNRIMWARLQDLKNLIRGIQKQKLQVQDLTQLCSILQKRILKFGGETIEKDKLQNDQKTLVRKIKKVFSNRSLRPVSAIFVQNSNQNKGCNQTTNGLKMKTESKYDIQKYLIKSKELKLKYQNKQQQRKRGQQYSKGKVKVKSNKHRKIDQKQGNARPNECQKPNSQSNEGQTIKINGIKKQVARKTVTIKQQSRSSSCSSSQIEKNLLPNKRILIADHFKADKKIKQLASKSIKLEQQENSQEQQKENVNDQQNQSILQYKKMWAVRSSSGLKSSNGKFYDKKRRQGVQLGNNQLLQSIKSRMVQLYWANKIKQNDRFTYSDDSIDQIQLKNTQEKTKKKQKKSSIKRRSNDLFGNNQEIEQFLALDTAKSIILQQNIGKRSLVRKKESLISLDQENDQKKCQKTHRKYFSQKYVKPAFVMKNHKKTLTSVEQNRVSFDQIFKFKDEYVNFLTQNPVQYYRSAQIETQGFNKQNGHLHSKQFMINNDIERKQKVVQEKQQLRKQNFDKQTKLLKMGNFFRKIYANRNIQQIRMRTQAAQNQAFFM